MRSVALGAVRIRGCTAFALVMTALAGSVALGQPARGFGEEALGAPSGVLRLTIAPTFETFDSRFLPDGETEPLGARLTSQSFGGSVFPSVDAATAAVRALGGPATFAGSLGGSRVLASTSINTLRLGAELGVASRLTVMATVPIVRTLTEFRVELNGASGNLGVNAALLDADLSDFHQSTLDAQAAAVATLQALIASCTAGGSDARCPTVQANLTTLQNLAADGGAATAAAAALYGPDAQFAPLSGSTTDDVIADRLNQLAAAFASFPSLGLPVYPGAVFTGASRPLGSNDVQALLTDDRFGIGIDSLVGAPRWGLGDIELGVRLLLLDTPGTERRLDPGAGVRLSVVGGARLGTGSAPDPAQPFDPGTGDGQHDLIGAAHLDLLFGSRFWTTVTGRYVYQLSDRLMMRIAPRSAPLAPVATLAEIDRDLGDIIEFEVAPRIALGRYVSIGARYAYRDKSEDRHEYADALGDSLALSVSASVLDSATAYTAQELGAGFTYSTVAAHARGLARWPLDVTYQHVESLSARDGYVPKVRRDEIRVRFYVRLFGGR